MRTYSTINALYDGATVVINGRRFKMDGDGKVSVPGDIYIAERNTGPRLLTAARVVGPGEGPNGFGGWVDAQEPHEYSYDTWECVRVREVEEEKGK